MAVVTGSRFRQQFGQFRATGVGVDLILKPFQFVLWAFGQERELARINRIHVAPQTCQSAVHSLHLVERLTEFRVIGNCELMLSRGIQSG